MFLPSFAPARAQDATSDVVILPATEATADVQPAAAPEPKRLTVLAAVAQAKELLKADLAKKLKAEKKPLTYASLTSPIDIVFAVWNRDTDAITLYDAVKKNGKITIKAAVAPAIKISLNSRLNSIYSLPEETHGVIVGVTYPLLTLTKVKKKSFYAANRVIYVPYSQAFFVPEVLAAGSDYLTFTIKAVFDELRAKGIKSHSFPDQLVTDVIDPYLIKSIVVIEHTSHKELLYRDDPETALGRFLVDLGLNGEAAFDAAVSTAGATGIVQFMPSTYKLYVKNRKDLGLISDFQKGMADHRNAIKAEVAYLDESLQDMPQNLRDLYARDASQAAGFLAAAYNGGSARVKRAFSYWGESWSDSHQAEITSLSLKDDKLVDEIEGIKKKLKKPLAAKEKKKLEDRLWTARKERKPITARLNELSKYSLKNETVLYVAKCKKVYGMFTMGMYATPNAPSGALPVEPAIAQKAQASRSVATTQQICFGDGCVPAEGLASP